MKRTHVLHGSRGLEHRRPLRSGCNRPRVPCAFGGRRVRHDVTVHELHRIAHTRLEDRWLEREVAHLHDVALTAAAADQQSRRGGERQRLRYVDQIRIRPAPEAATEHAPDAPGTPAARSPASAAAHRSSRSGSACRPAPTAPPDGTRLRSAYTRDRTPRPTATTAAAASPPPTAGAND